MPTKNRHKIRKIRENWEPGIDMRLHARDLLGLSAEVVNTDHIVNQEHRRALLKEVRQLVPDSSNQLENARILLHRHAIVKDKNLSFSASSWVGIVFAFFMVYLLSSVFVYKVTKRLQLNMSRPSIYLNTMSVSISQFWEAAAEEFLATSSKRETNTPKRTVESEYSAQNFTAQINSSGVDPIKVASRTEFDSKSLPSNLGTKEASVGNVSNSLALNQQGGYQTSVAVEPGSISLSKPSFSSIKASKWKRLGVRHILEAISSLWKRVFVTLFRRVKSKREEVDY